MGSQIDWQELERRAWNARGRAYAPYSRFLVGSAVIVKSGEIFVGCNIENICFGLTICAERAAVIAAISAGHQKLDGIAVVTDTEAPIAPCGACRQILCEFNRRLPVYAAGRNGSHKIWTVAELLPWPFDRIGG